MNTYTFEISLHTSTGETYGFSTSRTIPDNLSDENLKEIAISIAEEIKGSVWQIPIEEGERQILDITSMSEGSAHKIYHRNLTRAMKAFVSIQLGVRSPIERAIFEELCSGGRP